MRSELHRRGFPSDPLRRPVAVDLFAGAGGMSLGLEQAGFDVVAAVEYDPVHAATHEYNFPLTQVLCADVSKLDPEALREAARVGALSHGRGDWDGQLDAVVGGPPCQGFSFIGKRLVDDKRNRLVFHFFRLVSALQPRYFIMENVPGMASGDHAGILRQLIAEFQAAGYRFSGGTSGYRVLNAADYGVPQERRRLFLIGSRADQSRVDYPEPHVRRVPKRVGEATTVTLSATEDGPTAWDAICDIPDLDDFPELRQRDEVQLPPNMVGAISAAASLYGRRMRYIERDERDFSYARDWDPSLLTGSMRTKHTQKSIARFSQTRQGTTEPVSRFYRLDPGGLCNTLRAGSGSERGAFTSPRPIHPYLPRVLSNREAARLHSFPDWFRLHATKWHGFRQIGNAVAPLVGRAVGAQVMTALGVQPSVPAEPVPLGDRRLLNLTMRGAITHFGVDSGDVPPPRTRGATVAKVAVVESRGLRRR